jgi:hypothetical protein
MSSPLSALRPPSALGHTQAELRDDSSALREQLNALASSVIAIKAR